MNNQDLELRVKEILANENFFDMITAVFAFDKEYRGSEFYKATKMPLSEVVKGYKAWSMIKFDDIFNKIQNAINNLDLTKINEIIGELGDIYGQENADMMAIINSFKEIVE